jgi:SAM-dependent methyltransferase
VAGAVEGSATRWGPLWGARPEDWSISEEQHGPAYEVALARLRLEPGQRVLDVGCGTGSFLRLVAGRGAVAFGIDASETLIGLARERLPAADLRVGDMEHLPYDDERFDLVTGFTSFFFANDMVAALREAGRVARPGAPVVAQVWGAHERCDLEAMKAIARPYLPPRPPDAAPDADVAQPGMLAWLARQAGLTPEDEFTASFAYTFADGETLGRAMLAPAGLALLVAGREDEVAAAIVDGLAPFRQPDGSYRLENEYRYLIARA